MVPSELGKQLGEALEEIERRARETLCVDLRLIPRAPVDAADAA
jgi:hypothetical protein